MLQTILGANGVIGKLLAKELNKYTNTVRLVSRNPKKINDTDELFPADLSDTSVVDKAVAGSEIVYLVIGFEYKLSVWQKKWPALMKATIDACIKYNSKLVFFDNVYVYAKEEIGNMTEDSLIDPPSKKGLVRKEVSELLMSAVKEGKLTALIARSADFYGPNNSASFLTETVYKNLKKGKASNWFMDAGKKHSFTFTPDAAKATALLGNTPEAYNQVWHLPTDPNPLTGKEYNALFAKEMNQQNKISVLPMWMLKILGIFIPVLREMPEMMYQYDREYIFNSSKFDSRFGIKPTPYAEGISRTVKETNE